MSPPQHPTALSSTGPVPSDATLPNVTVVRLSGARLTRLAATAAARPQERRQWSVIHSTATLARQHLIVSYQHAHHRRVGTRPGGGG